MRLRRAVSSIMRRLDKLDLKFQVNGAVRGFVIILRHLGPDILLIGPISC